MSSPTPTPAPESDLLTIGDAARQLGVSTDTIRRWDRKGLITTTRTPGGQRRIPGAEIARILTRRQGSREAARALRRDA